MNMCFDENNKKKIICHHVHFNSVAQNVWVPPWNNEWESLQKFDVMAL